MVWSSLIHHDRINLHYFPKSIMLCRLYLVVAFRLNSTFGAKNATHNEMPIFDNLFQNRGVYKNCCVTNFFPLYR